MTPTGPYATRVHCGAANLPARAISRLPIFRNALFISCSSEHLLANLIGIFRRATGWGVLVEIGLGVVMNLVHALAGALLLSLICETVEAQVAREAFYSIPSET